MENLPRPKILDFLLKKHNSLVIPYLEHVIHTWNDNSPLFHDALINMYSEKITNKKENATEAEIEHTKAKLVAFLEKSTHYTPERFVLHFPKDGFFEERAIIYGKLGRHEQALAIYVLILGESRKYFLFDSLFNLLSSQIYEFCKVMFCSGTSAVILHKYIMKNCSYPSSKFCLGLIFAFVMT